MQWDASENARFSTHTPWIGCGDTYREINVAKQLEDKDSVFLDSYSDGGKLPENGIQVLRPYEGIALLGK